MIAAVPGIAVLIWAPRLGGSAIVSAILILIAALLFTTGLSS